MSEKPKLMVVDDEPENLDLLYRTFRRQFQIFKADGPIGALEMLDREGEMAVIISDQLMPQMNGIEFLTSTIERFPDTIRILLSGLGEEMDGLADKKKKAQVFKLITKPCNIDELKAVVQEAAEIYQAAKLRNDVS
ncbi:response regulator [Argonema galeatum]|uniref:response regulator n=1 Tax=Argonema galeatum TaxID=2942762 RepID=UPI0020133129|nr:response regulator [Argonema galeatum]MCL1468998.1 response regulator [Argonema galeatum A003/A1]